MTAETLPVPGHRHGVVDGMPMDEYLAWSALSASSARKLLPPSCPALFRQQQLQPDVSADMDLGKIAHHLVLEGGVPDGFLVIVDAENWRTKAAQEAKEQARVDGKVAMLRGGFEQVAAMAQAIVEHPLASALFDPDQGLPEQSMFWTDPRSGVPRKGRLDYLPARRSSGRLIVPDYKTAASAERSEWARSAVNYGYHQQAAGYAEGLAALGLDDDPQIVFVVQEKRPPYLVNVLQLDDDAMRIAGELNRWACATYAECLTTDRWPGYSDGVELVQLPGWYLRNHEEMTYA